MMIKNEKKEERGTYSEKKGKVKEVECRDSEKHEKERRKRW